VALFAGGLPSRPPPVVLYALFNRSGGPGSETVDGDERLFDG
jgi:hypothetical protein